ATSSSRTNEQSASGSSAPSDAQATKASSPAQRSSRRAMGFRVVKAGEEIVLLLACQSEMPRLHVSETTDFFRDRRDLYRQRMVRRRELCEQALDIGFVFGDQGALGAPLGGVPEWLEWRTDQAAMAFQPT